ncbi:carbohydrate ABC transporter permease [Bacillus sp. FJAT-49711]|uniref:carbohydrate ABC transporter permease n=1 Tax=Bacillus sp. FJAT-49711 TaxID=2833585 RepID=UPI001BC93E6E|nr:carbohydrate ABC transporter permease [Bacillus sp. FJAT-49711]MBS4219085.1 carbohydrate ABC transporter permease [Bacillus sp. FJAT-49711]
MILPFVWTLLTSFKTQAEALKIPPQIMPNSWGTFNYEKVNETLPFVKLFLNTTLMVTFRCIGSVFLSALAGFAFARLKFPLRNFFFMLILVQMMVPGQIFILPQYLIVSKLGLLNTITALVIPGFVSTFGTFLLRQFFLSIPKDLEEAAILDGCSIWKLFWFVMLPLTRSGMVSVGIFTALFAWKDLMWPLVVNMSIDKMTLSSGLVTLMGQYSIDYPQLMAGSLIAIVPMVILFLIFQKQFLEGIATTGIK